jgi:uncharacterized protein involved in outer membrane biogenesis
MKKVMKILGSIAAVFLVLILTIPFFVNVDHYRPEIVKAVNEKLNGELELGKLSLSLWGRVHVGVDGVKLKDANKAQVLAVKDAAFDLPYLSILSGSPLITFVMKEPEISVSKDKAGKLNVMSLVKVQVAAPAAGSVSAGSAGSSSVAPSSSEVRLPALVLNAHFGMSVINAKLVYQDATLALTNTVDHLNVRVKDFSLTRKTEVEVWADLKTRMGTDLSVEGPLKFTLGLTPDVSGGEFKSATLDGTFSADDLSIEKGALFVKNKGVPAHLKFKASLDQSELKLKESVIVFHNAEVQLKGAMHKDQGADLKFEAKPVDLKPWSDLVPMLKEYELEGKLGLKGEVNGKPEALHYAASVSIDQLSAKGPHLKAKPVFSGALSIVTDKIERFSISMKGPGNDLSLEGKLSSFTKPDLAFVMKSTGMDLDQWIEFPKPEAASPAGKAESAAAPSQGGAKGSEKSAGKPSTDDYDALLDPVRSNEIARAMTVDGNVSIAFIKAKGVRMDDLSAKLQMKNLIASVSGLKLKMYGGLVSGAFGVDMKPKEPQYTLNFTASGLEMQKAVESQFQSFKNTLSGKLSASVQGGGASFNPETAKKRLQMKGDFKLLDGTFRTLDIAKMAGEAINGSLGKIAEKVPVLKGKNLKVNSNADSRYDVISGSFTLRDGILDAPNFMAKAIPQHGIDLKGATRMGIIDESLDAKWELTDTYRLTGADRLSVDIAGKTISNFLAKSEKDPVVIPISVGCKWSAPCTHYDQVAEYLAGVAAGRLSHVAQDVVKQKVQETLKKGVGDALKGLFGH